MAIHQRLHVVLPLVYQTEQTCQENQLSPWLLNFRQVFEFHKYFLIS